MKKYLLLAVCFTIVSSCNISNKRINEIDDSAHTNQSLLNCINSQVVLPINDMIPVQNGRIISIDTSFFQKQYILVSITGRDACTSCSLKAYFQWDNVVDILGEDIGYCFIIQPDLEYEINDLIYILNQNYFSFPVYFDNKLFFNEQNPIFPKGQSYCLLLDQNKKVIYIGDPLRNNKALKHIIAIIK